MEKALQWAYMIKKRIKDYFGEMWVWNGLRVFYLILLQIISVSCVLFGIHSVLLTYTFVNNLFVLLVSTRSMIMEAINAITIAVNAPCYKFHEEEEVKEINKLIITTGQT